MRCGVLVCIFSIAIEVSFVGWWQYKFLFGQICGFAFHGLDNGFIGDNIYIWVAFFDGEGWARGV